MRAIQLPVLPCTTSPGALSRDVTLTLQDAQPLKLHIQQERLAAGCDLPGLSRNQEGDPVGRWLWGSGG